jgi:lipase maturation factor 1
MDKYYENGPLPTWLGWYVQQWPHPFHAFTAALTLIVEIFIVWLLFLPKRSRAICFFIVTPLQIGIILTANYAFLNYLVLTLGVLLLDDAFLSRRPPSAAAPHAGAKPVTWRTMTAAVALTWIFVATISVFFFPASPPLNVPGLVLEPFRIANRFGLFAVMTRSRYEIEFHGTADGEHWVAYPFRYKPQDLRKPPGIYAPYQPRLDWNLWFASLGPWRENEWVVAVEVRLLQNEPSVLRLFAGNPFASRPPRAVRTMLWQYWFTTASERAATGAWWKRELMGAFAPAVARRPDGSIEVANEPGQE